MRAAKALAATCIVWIILAGASPWADLPDCLRGPFHGITATDPNGEILGHTDHSDWGCAEVSPADARVGVSQGAQGTADIPVPPPPPGICMRPASPNPLVSATTLLLSLGEDHHVRLAVYGQSRGNGPPHTFLVRTLLESDLRAGFHSITWDAKNDQGQRVALGLYRVLMEAEGKTICGDIQVQ